MTETKQESFLVSFVQERNFENIIIECSTSAEWFRASSEDKLKLLSKLIARKLQTTEILEILHVANLNKVFTVGKPVFNMGIHLKGSADTFHGANIRITGSGDGGLDKEWSTLSSSDKVECLRNYAAGKFGVHPTKLCILSLTNLDQTFG
jgi:glutamate synthase domain-containing protein 2